MISIVSLLERFDGRADEFYECRTCGAGFSVQYHVCPACQGFSVDPVYADPAQI